MADYDFLRYDQATVGAAIIARAREAHRTEILWTSECLQVTGLVFDDIRECYEQVKALDHAIVLAAPANFEFEVTHSPKSVCCLAYSFSKAVEKRAL